MSDDGEDDDVGYGKPPKSRQFQPGRSGNRRGRPPKKKPEARSDYGDGLTPFDRDFLDEGKRRLRGRDGNRAIELSQDRAAMRGLYARAIRGSPMANRIIIEETRRVQTKVLRMKQEIWDSYQAYVSRCREAEARAKAQGRPAPTFLPHPDDIEFADDLCVYALGPINAEQLKRSQTCVDFRDLFLAMHVYGITEQKNPRFAAISRPANAAILIELRIEMDEWHARAIRFSYLRKRDVENHMRTLCERVDWPFWVAIDLARKPPKVTLETMGFKRVLGLLVRERGWSAAKQEKRYWANASVDHLTTETLEFLIALGLAGPPSWIARARASIAARKHVESIEQ